MRIDSTKSLHTAHFYPKDYTDTNQTASTSPQYANSSCIYKTTKLRQLHPTLRAKSSERKRICPLSLDTITASHSSSSLVMTLKPESSLPNIGNGSFSDFPLQSIYYQGKIYFYFLRRTQMAIKRTTSFSPLLSIHLLHNLL